MRDDQVADRFVDERRSPADHLEQDAAERVDVGPVIDPSLRPALLGRHVHRRTDEVAAQRVVFGDLLAHFEQNQSLRFAVETAFGCQLSHRLAAQA